MDRLVCLTRCSPVLLVIEDAHWIDPSTLELLERLTETIPSLPIMMIVTHRPEWRSDRISGLGNVTGLAIGPLNRAQIAELAAAILQGEPDAELIGDIAARTDGVPLFVEELARAIAERDGVTLVKSANIPMTLQASLMARLDRLPPEAKRTALIASVIGRDFDEMLLRQVSDLKPEALREVLEELRRARIVVGSATAPEAHVFRHALIQDTAYQSLLLDTRRVHHRRIAKALEIAHPAVVEREPELIARHFSEAREPEAALPYWVRAAKRALARSANFEAVSHAEAALTAVGELKDDIVRERETLVVQLVMGRALETVGRLKDATGVLRAAAATALKGSDPATFAEAVLGFDNALFLAADPVHDAIPLLEEALKRTPDSAERTRCELLSRLARGNLLIGNGPAAAEHNRKAGALARKLDDGMSLFNLHVNDFLAPMSARGASDACDWRERLDEMAALAENLNDDARGRSLSFDIFISAEMGDRDRMDRAIDRLDELGETRQHMHQQWIARHGRAMQAILDGDFDVTERHAEAALSLGGHTYGSHVAGVYGIQMFTIRREQKRLAEAAPILKRLGDENPDQALWRPGFALIACELGFRKPASRILDEIAQARFSFPLDAVHSLTMAYLAEVCVPLGTRSGRPKSTSCSFRTAR